MVDLQRPADLTALPSHATAPPPLLPRQMGDLHRLRLLLQEPDDLSLAASIRRQAASIRDDPENDADEGAAAGSSSGPLATAAAAADAQGLQGELNATMAVYFRYAFVPLMTGAWCS